MARTFVTMAGAAALTGVLAALSGAREARNTPTGPSR